MLRHGEMQWVLKWDSGTWRVPKYVDLEQIYNKRLLEKSISELLSLAGFPIGKSME